MHVFKSLRDYSSRLIDPEYEEVPQEEQSQTWSQRLASEAQGLCPSLSLKERLIGFSVCMVIGFTLSFGSAFRLIKLVHGNPVPFALTYSIGNILSLGSTTFFAGPVKQFKSMFAKTRWVSTTIYLASISATVTICVADHFRGRMLLVLVLIVIQFLALAWYTLSFIPYGRSMAMGAMKGMGCCPLANAV